ncbi:MAG: hypothetical protein EOP44_00310 [Sphingobacteriaceae bacterium]|nr:MAG: hypothetical protein EOP44_00310 [Sphingobacteriaceae bacterium]
MKDELIDNLNAAIERKHKTTASALNLLGINKVISLIKSFKNMEMDNFDEVNLIKNFLRSFS